VKNMPLLIPARMSNEKAFTLIEVIVALVLVGIIAAVAGMGLVQITQGYVFTKKNAETVQKAQIAIARISKELGAATSIAATPTSASITYTRDGSITNTITISGNSVQMSGSNSGMLVDDVASYPTSSFIYYNGAGASFTPTASTTPTIKRIDINLTVNGSSFNNNTVIVRETF